MYKIISFPKTLGYSICAKKLKENQSIMPSVRHCESVGCLLVAQDEFEKLTKLIGREGYTVSNEVQVRLHSKESKNNKGNKDNKDEIPWGVEHIGAPGLWHVTKGKGIKVAVIDTGISQSHPDLKGQIKGKVSVIAGAGRFNMGGHGTHVAGTIAAVANNRGIVGIAPEVDLYDVQAFGADGTANISDIIAGINWAIEQKVDIINMSFGTSEDHPAFHQALRVASRNGIVLVASAGNNGGGLEYPAAYREVIAVGAINQQAKLAEFSARGRGMNTVAPGVGIKSTWLNKGYRTLDGTSMAAAHISGLYALRLAQQRTRAMNRFNKRMNFRWNNQINKQGEGLEKNQVKNHVKKHKKNHDKNLEKDHEKNQAHASETKSAPNRQNRFNLLSLFKRR
ncbi:S8 family peptidase [Brevibacillus laterosporus]|uniref:S8 family peptidase n=1 Tax=Brevibacillus laterosporus TaxID=1465 RepID=UPI002651322C|nr:S8 family peptidase [Brevibacillus laterosporus]MDN9011032.1 S8 family peptidase [Brevibacillus laterosporus]MDO0942055.1 S8 family peptidase [Brevibacillus laterosporus]